MKTMQNFAAQQLSKKQMNEVKGGAKFICFTGNNMSGIYQFDDLRLMYALLEINGGGECHRLPE